jgi:hypothetical protein
MTTNSYGKIANVINSIGKLRKDSRNPFFKSQYLSLNAILDNLMPLLEENGLLVVQPVLDDSLETYVIDVESGMTLVKSSFKIINTNDPQKRLAECSYYRRGALQSLFMLNVVDDDGESLVNRKAGKVVLDPSKPMLEDLKPLEEALKKGFVMDIGTVRAKYNIKAEDIPKIETLIKKYS